MDLTQLANLGEFIGGVAVLVTLVYLAAQVRQSAQAQRQANELAKAEALQKSVASYSTMRQMLVDEGINALWFKAVHDEELAPVEEQRLFVVLQELTYSALAALSNHQAAGNLGQVEITPGLVARIVGQSRTLRRIWEPMADELAISDLAGFALAINQHLETDHARP